MIEHVRNIPGERLALAPYRADFAAIHQGAPSSWKLERQQDFVELDDPSWDAAAADDWEAAMRLANEVDRRETAAEAFALNARGMVRRRLRIVTAPLSRYLRWELAALTIRAEYGEQIRIGSPDLVKPYEVDGELPEIVGLGDEVMYHILYDKRGALAGGRKITNPGAIAACHHEVVQLWERGEDIADYVGREVVPLVPFLP